MNARTPLILLLAAGIAGASVAPRAARADVHVWTNSPAPAPPYDAWPNASRDIQTALDYASANALPRVTVTDGVYGITRSLTVADAVTLESVNGADATVIQRASSTNHRIVACSHTGAVIRGFTIRGGIARSDCGGGAHMTAGTIEDCAMVSNSAADNIQGGGGIYLASNAVARRCVIQGNAGYHYGGGAYLHASGGRLESCVISNNSAFVWGGGLHLSGGLALNCLIVANRLTGNNSTYGGGGVRINGGTLLHSTVADNATPDATPGAGLRRDGGGITNCIVQSNRRGVFASDISGSLAGIAFSCSPDLSGAATCTGDNPEFVDSARGNYRLAPGSPCIDAGTNTAGAIDLDGALRPLDGNADSVARADIGAYEAAPLDSGPLRCNFLSPAAEAMESGDIAFQAWVAGSNAASLSYRWDFNGDGTNDLEIETAAATNRYDRPGLYDVHLTVANPSGESAFHPKPDFVAIRALRLFVATNGASIAPYTNWGMATASLSDVLPLAGDGTTIIISNGVFTTPGAVISRGVEMRGLEGAARSILVCTVAGNRVLDVAHSNAVIRDLTLTGGALPDLQYGAGIRLSAGTARDCIVSNNTRVGAGSSGTGVYLSGPALVENCLITENYGFHYGGGVRLGSADALVRNCIIVSNAAAIWGGGIYAEAGTARNCLVARNRLTGSHPTYGGGGVRLLGARLENCTIAANFAPSNSPGGGIRFDSGSITNCIVYDNTRGATNNNIEGATNSIGWSCSPGVAHGASGNITNAPRFVDPEHDDWRLQRGSPCVDAGRPQPWMSGAGDLDSRPRVRRNGPDMGAYELSPYEGGLSIQAF